LEFSREASSFLQVNGSAVQSIREDGNLSNLPLLRLMNDHFGNFSVALDGVDTPELEIADNAYAVGMVADTIAHSRRRRKLTSPFDFHDLLRIRFLTADSRPRI
jgi:hypothetical protein